ncbi:MAG TPA: HD domain-containing protein, partial [Candidatus Binataceae bacterium]|nr:HD domain-containing protein [Candidatus Binataceae bacterium]
MEELVQAPSEPQELDELARRVAAYNPEADFSLIRRAYDYSARMHGDQKRESGEPYVTHPLNVALIAAQLKLDVPSLETALLHDVVEDTSTSLQDVEHRFGAEVARLVD